MFDAMHKFKGPSYSVIFFLFLFFRKDVNDLHIYKKEIFIFIKEVVFYLNLTEGGRWEILA